MTTMELAVIVPTLPRNPWHLVRAFVATWREHKADRARCAELAAAYRQGTQVTAGRIRGVYPSHRAPRPVRVRRARVARAPKVARHTSAVLAGQGWHPIVPDGWYRRGYRQRGVPFALAGV